MERPATTANVAGKMQPAPRPYLQPGVASLQDSVGGVDDGDVHRSRADRCVGFKQLTRRGFLRVGATHWSCVSGRRKQVHHGLHARPARTSGTLKQTNKQTNTQRRATSRPAEDCPSLLASMATALRSRPPSPVTIDESSSGPPATSSPPGNAPSRMVTATLE